MSQSDRYAPSGFPVADCRRIDPEFPVLTRTGLSGLAAFGQATDSDEARRADAARQFTPR
jgi:hypothetical protein